MNTAFLIKKKDYLMISANKLTSVILPKAFNVDYVGLEVGLCRLHIHIVSHMVHTVLEAAVLTVCALLA